MVLFTPRLVRIALSNVSVLDEGGYFCQLYTDDTHHQVATLTVIVPPETPTVEVKTQAVEGGEVELTCHSPRSKPPATLRWMRDRREIPGVCHRLARPFAFLNVPPSPTWLTPSLHPCVPVPQSSCLCLPLPLVMLHDSMPAFHDVTRLCGPNQGWTQCRQVD